MDKIMYVYVVTNKINHKRYVGITTRTIEQHWTEHKQMAKSINHKDSKSIFKKAIRKYGDDAWIVEQLDTAQTLDELKQKEIYWIKTLKTYAFDDDGWGYNSTRGGDYVDERCYTPVYICDIISGTIIKECKSIAEAEDFTNTRIEDIGKENRACNGYCILKVEENKDLSSEELRDKIHSLYPCLVYQLDLDGNIVNIYRNTTLAAEAIQCPSGNLIMACEGKRRLCHDFQWCYQRDLKDRLGQPVRDIKTTEIPIKQYSMGGAFIRNWPSARSVMNKKGISDSHINQVCNGTRDSAGGFQWRYANEELFSLDPLYTKRKVQCIETKEIFETPNHAAKKFNYAQQTVKKMCMNDGKGSKDYHFIWWDDLDPESED